MILIPGKILPAVALAVLGFLATSGRARGQTYQPTGWVNDPFCPNVNYALMEDNLSNPCFTNNGVQRGTLYANAPIGAALKLTAPGDTIACTGQVSLTGDVNPAGNLQFRFGVYYQGSNAADTNWLGYMFGNITGDPGGAATGFMVRNNPNPGIYASATAGNAMRPPCDHVSYNAGWSEGTYDFNLSVTLLPANAHKISWQLMGIAPNAYSYTGDYTNTFALTAPPAFDQVGILAGAALFNSASISNSVSVKNLKVTFSNAGGNH